MVKIKHCDMKRYLWLLIGRSEFKSKLQTLIIYDRIIYPWNGYRLSTLLISASLLKLTTAKLLSTDVLMVRLGSGEAMYNMICRTTL
jgi:hypothetical protein